MASEWAQSHRGNFALQGFVNVLSVTLVYPRKYNLSSVLTTLSLSVSVCLALSLRLPLEITIFWLGALPFACLENISLLFRANMSG